MNEKTLLTFLLFCVINGQPDCSLEKKCGTYGYCYVDNNATFCECKFWWKGDLCNQQSNSGKQVIILGCLTCFLIICFYGIKIARAIYLKLTQPKEEKKKKQSQNDPLSTVIGQRLRSFMRLSSCIVTIMTVIVASLSLIIKWLLLRGIHDEVVRRYLNKQTVYFTQKPFCTNFFVEGLNILVISAAILLIILCTIMTKRVSLLKHKCHGYGAPPIPIDFLSSINRKSAAVVFAVVADELIAIVKEIIESSQSNLGILVEFLLRISQVLIMGCRFFPLLACVYINTFVTLAGATIYAWLDFSFTIASESICNPTNYPTYEENFDNSSQITEKLMYYGTGPAILAIELGTEIPKCVCYSYICVKLTVMSIKKFYHHWKANAANEKPQFVPLRREDKYLINISRPNSVEMLYVKNLFRPSEGRSQSQSLLARIIPKFIYEWRDDFEFSSLIVCIYSSVFLLLFYVVIQAFVDVIPTLHARQSDFQAVANFLSDTINLFKVLSPNNNANADKAPLNFPVPNLVYPYICAVILTTIVIVLQLLVFLANIRRNLIQVYRGDDSEIPRRRRTEYLSYSTGNFHFAGYFIGYLVWGFVTVAIVFATICTCISAFITYSNVKPIEKILKLIIPSLLLVIFKIYANNLLAQYVFLQHFGDVLALNNRRLFMIFIYFNFFLDAFLGFISAVIRFLLSTIAVAFYMCRLDYAPLGRKLESFDGGFRAYCGFLHTECTHRHPIMLVFVSHLFSQLKRRHYDNNDIELGTSRADKNYAVASKKPSKYTRKWRLAAFLIRNPTILFFRKAFLKELSEKKHPAINELDGSNPNSALRELMQYTSRMAVQRLSFVDATHSQTLVQQF